MIEHTRDCIRGIPSFGLCVTSDVHKLAPTPWDPSTFIHRYSRGYPPVLCVRMELAESRSLFPTKQEDKARVSNDQEIRLLSPGGAPGC